MAQSRQPPLHPRDAARSGVVRSPQWQTPGQAQRAAASASTDASRDASRPAAATRPRITPKYRSPIADTLKGR